MEDKNRNFTPQVFRSRYSIILTLIIVLPFIKLLFAFIQNPGYINSIPLFIVGFVISIVSGIRYVVADNKLIFKTWFINNGEISIYSIKKIERSYFLLASNAGSLKRVFCQLKKGSKYPFLVLSPKNETKFLELLKEINPKIEIKVENKKGFYRFWDWDI